MKNLKVWKKLALIGLVFLIPLVAMAGFLVWQIKTLSVDITREELAGIEVADGLLDLVRDLQLYRAWTAGGPAFAVDRETVKRRALNEILPGISEHAAVAGKTTALLNAPPASARRRRSSTKCSIFCTSSATARCSPSIRRSTRFTSRTSSWSKVQP